MLMQILLIYEQTTISIYLTNDHLTTYLLLFRAKNCFIFNHTIHQYNKCTICIFDLTLCPRSTIHSNKSHHISYESRPSQRYLSQVLFLLLLVNLILYQYSNIYQMASSNSLIPLSS